MRQPINTVPGYVGAQVPSHAASLYVEWWKAQPGSPGADGSTVVGRLDVVDGNLSDDAARNVARTMNLTVATWPSTFKVGMWIRPTLGIQRLQPEIYRLPTMVVTRISQDMTRTNAVTVTADDPGTVLNGRPYEVDTTLTGTLRALVSAACTLALTRPTDVSGVPDLAIPAGTVAEFGAGRWDTCLTVADDLGVALRFTDAGDVVGRLRSAAAPGSSSLVDGALIPGGDCNYERAPTDAAVLVTRGNDAVGLVGRATAQSITGIAPPSWYPRFTITDRLEGDPTTTQAQADALAKDLLTVRLQDLKVYVDTPILPAPWLEAGADTVSYYGKLYWVRALNLDLPSLRMTVTLRVVDPTGVGPYES